MFFAYLLETVCCQPAHSRGVSPERDVNSPTRPLTFGMWINRWAWEEKWDQLLQIYTQVFVPLKWRYLFGPPSETLPSAPRYWASSELTPEMRSAALPPGLEWFAGQLGREGLLVGCCPSMKCKVCLEKWEQTFSIFVETSSSGSLRSHDSVRNLEKPREDAFFHIHRCGVSLILEDFSGLYIQSLD